MPELSERTTPYIGSYWPDLARHLQMPVLLVDYQFTRRAKIHILEYPVDRYPFSSTRLLECIEQADSAGYSRVMLAYQQREEAPQLVVADLSQPSPEVLHHG